MGAAAFGAAAPAPAMLLKFMGVYAPKLPSKLLTSSGPLGMVMEVRVWRPGLSAAGAPPPREKVGNTSPAERWREEGGGRAEDSEGWLG